MGFEKSMVWSRHGAIEKVGIAGQTVFWGIAQLLRNQKNSQFDGNCRSHRDKV